MTVEQRTSWKKRYLQTSLIVFSSAIALTGIASCGTRTKPTSAQTTAHSANSVAELSSLIGKSIRGKEFQTWLSNVGTEPVVENPLVGVIFYNFQSKGISWRCDGGDILRAVHLYAEGTHGYRQYQGELPFGLTFLQTRKDIELVLGQPRSDDNNVVQAEYALFNYRNGIGIKYSSSVPDDQNARILVISMTEPVR